MRYRVRYIRNPHQKEFDEDTTSKLLHLSSGFGGGKSHAIVAKSFQLSRLNRGIPGGCVVPTIADFKKDLLPLYEEILETNRIPYKYHKTDKWFQFPWSTGRMYVTSAEKRIRGPNWGWAVINEVTLISHERYKETLGRVRIKRTKFPQIASSGTPEGMSHWAYEVFVENPAPRTRIIYGDTRDNQANLNDDYIPTLEASYDPIMLDAYLRGLFVNMKGNRFYYGYDPKKNDNPKLDRIPGLDVIVTLDYNVSPMVATLGHLVPFLNERGKPETYPDGTPMKKAIFFDQIVIADGAETKKMCSAFRAHGLDPDHTVIYPDPAGRNRSTKGPPDNQILKNEGWHRIKTKLVAPQFRKRQLAVCNLLTRGQFELNPKRCKALKKDLEAVEQDPATYEKLKDNPKLTHASDGADYFIDIEFPLSGQKPDSGSTKIR
jgi:hypothetical protein